VQRGIDQQGSVLTVALEVLQVADKDSVHSCSDNVGKDGKDDPGNDDHQSDGDGRDGLSGQVQDSNGIDDADRGSKELANKEDKLAEKVDDGNRKQVSLNELKAVSGRGAEALSVHGNVDVGKSVDELNQLGNAAQDALSEADEDSEVSVSWSSLDLFQQKVQKLNNGEDQRAQGERSKRLGPSSSKRLEGGGARECLGHSGGISGKVPRGNSSGDRHLEDGSQEGTDPEEGKDVEVHQVSDLGVELKLASVSGKLLIGNREEEDKGRCPEANKGSEHGNDDGGNQEDGGVVLDSSASLSKESCGQGNLLSQEDDADR